MKLKDTLLLKHDAAWFHKFALSAGIDQNAPVSDIADKLAEALLTPSVMRERMIILRDEDIDFFQYVSEHGPVIPAKSFYQSADRLRSMDYACVIDNDMHLIIPEDVKEVYDKETDTPEFQARRKKMSWLYDCISFIPYLYAILSVGDLGTLYRKRHGYDDSNEEIVMSMLRELMNNHEEIPCTLHGNELIVNGLEKAQEEKLRQLHASVPTGFPGYGEMKDILHNGYPLKDNAWKSLRQYFIHDIHVTDDFIDALLEMIWKYMTTGNPYSVIIKNIRGEGIPVTGEQEKTLKKLLTNTWSVTRMMMCNGHVPSETLPGQTYIFEDN